MTEFVRDDKLRLIFGKGCDERIADDDAIVRPIPVTNAFAFRV